MDVSTDFPFSIAAIEQPFPRWQVINLNWSLVELCSWAKR